MSSSEIKSEDLANCLANALEETRGLIETLTEANEAIAATLRAANWEIIRWVPIEEGEPTEPEDHLVFIPEWGDICDDTIAVAAWCPAWEGVIGHWDGYSYALEEGAPVSHWAKVEGPNR